jgi:hypothetical protein
MKGESMTRKGRNKLPRNHSCPVRRAIIHDDDFHSTGEIPEIGSDAFQRRSKTEGFVISWDDKTEKRWAVHAMVTSRQR